MQVRKATMAFQEVNWQITMIQNQTLLFFNQYPSFMLNSVTKTISGHTGCNNIYGSYQYDLSQKENEFLMLRAQHLSCDKALAQEADLMDAMQRIERFKLKGRICIY